jgi:ATP-dependent helicase HrpA
MTDHLEGERARNLKLEFPAELPITEHVEEIREHLERHQVVVVAGETGSGKTTQLPKICLGAGLGGKGMIGHTQPRRLAARAVANRIAEELGVSLGQEVGYAVRFDEKVAEETRVKLMTDGLLLTEIRRDRNLSRYDCIIVDEAHERSLNIDFLLGYLKGVLRRRRDLKLIITSATIDVAAFSSHFGNAPVVEVGGRTFPVTVRYLDEEAVLTSQEDQLLSVLEDIETGPQSRARDILMFLPGEREILETARFLRESVGERLEVLPLYARLSAADQQRIFHPGKRRRIVLATNVAETSLTVPNIGYVIDPGVARVSRYSFRSKIQRLPVEGISQASADQRAGRCGRVAPGVCFRLYTEEDFAARSPYTDPEIKRTNLASVVLQMLAFGLGEPRRFPFLDPPDPRLIGDAEKVLHELGALDGKRLTPVGGQMARLPIDPRLARMIVAAESTRSLSEVLVIASALAVSDPRERPLEKQGSADRAHEKWLDERSDFLGFLNLWNWYEAQRVKLSRSQLRRATTQNFLSNNRMREWRALHRQLLLSVRGLGFRLNSEAADYASLHKALLAGSLSLIGLHDERGDYLGARNLKFRIFPGSAIAEKRPKWVVAGEIVETRRVYARTVAGVEARWIEEAAGHLVRRRHADPHWSLNRGEAQIYETVTLYGLQLADRRRVSLKRVDAARARDLLLLDGLVRGAVKKPPEFLAHNLALAAEIRDDEDKERRRDLLLPEAEIAARYDRLIPETVASVRDLARWLSKAPWEVQQALFFSRDDLLAADAARPTEEDFPGRLTIAGHEFSVAYRFAPGEVDDGVSLKVPMGLMSMIIPEALDWSVPGMLGGVCEQWLRSLPKQKRRLLTPIPDTVADILPLLSHPSRYRQGRFDVALAEVLEQVRGVHVAANEWNRERIDPYWRMNVQVLDPDGRRIAEGRDAEALKARFVEEVAARVQGGAADAGDRSGLTDFPEESLAESVVLGKEGRQVVAYPALADEGDSVALRHLPEQRMQAEVNRGGFARLALLKLGQTVRYLKKQITADRELGLLFAPLGGGEYLRDELLKAGAWACFFADRPLPRDGASFMERIQKGRGELAEVLAEIQARLKEALAVRHQLMQELEQATSPAYAPTVEDIRAQVAALVPADILSVTPAGRIGDLARYLEAARHRLGNLQGKVERDRELAATISSLGERIERLGEALDRQDPRWIELRFQLEEVRVGVFAERLGVRQKASPKRLSRQLEALEREHGLI